MLICIDESGSINNHDDRHPYFVITLVRVLGKGTLKGKYQKFCNRYMERLKTLDIDNKMFDGEKLLELKGCYFDNQLRHEFINFFKTSSSYEIYYIKFTNSSLSDNLCRNKERAFNYPLKTAICYFLRKGMLPNEDCRINLDNRNLKTGSRMQLDEYINTELAGESNYQGTMVTEYFDSKDNHLIQVADVFSNIFYASLFNEELKKDIEELKSLGRIRYIFEFPTGNNISE
jgi:hypothetical protein